MDLKATKYDGERVKYITTKLDGHRYTIHRERDDIRVLSRTKDVNIWPKLEDTRIGNLIEALPAFTEMECELHAVNVHATSVPTLINEASELLLCSGFALPQFGGADHRDTDLPMIHVLLEEAGFHPPEILWCELTPEAVDPEHWRRWAIRHSAEGVIAKVAHCEGWYKIKPVKELDAVVTGWEMGTGRNIGRLGALRIAVFTPDGDRVDIGKVGTGFDDDARDVITKADIGRVIEVEYDEVNARGALKFPRFVRFRDDKRASECSTLQLEDDK